jgi:hypothetical protein
MDYSKFKNAKHPCAETRHRLLHDEITHGDKNFSAAFAVMQSMFHASEDFLYRQYYWRDAALNALEIGDIEGAKECLNEIGKSD